MYQPEGDRLNWPGPDDHAHFEVLRLPEDWQKPRPLELGAQFLGNDPIVVCPKLHWPGKGGYVWEPRLVGYGGYELFGFALEVDKRRQDVIGHQLLVDFDLRLTGTERFHVQFRPLGEQNTGGSYYQFSDPSGYVDNSTGEPQRYWFEGELHSMLGAFLNPFAALDYHVTVGRFPFALHNTLLINDEFLGLTVNKNSIYVPALSNLNLQTVIGFNDVGTPQEGDGRLYGLTATADHRNDFYELSYVFVERKRDPTRDAHYAALSRTTIHGPLTMATRALLKWGDRGGRGSGQLFALESNWVRPFSRKPVGFEKGVLYANAFLATKGWSPVATGNFNRLTTAFEVDPLVQIAAGIAPDDNWGAALGVQLFRHHQDESLIPEIAYQSPMGVSVWGLGLRYQRKTSARTFFELLSVFNFSNDSRFDRAGVFASNFILF